MKSPSFVHMELLVLMLTLSVAAAVGAKDMRRRGWLHPRKDQKTSYACEGSRLPISCEDDKIIRIIRANYGRFSISVCNPHHKTDGWNLQCSSKDSVQVVAERCDGHPSCEVQIINRYFGDPCPDTYKYLEVQYYCTKDDFNTEINPSEEETGEDKRTTTTTPEPTTTPKPTPTPKPTKKPVRPATKPTEKPTKPTTTQRQHTEFLTCGATTEGGVLWGDTDVGGVFYADCPKESYGRAVWKCGKHGWKGKPDFSDCKSAWMIGILKEVDDGSSMETVMANVRSGTEYLALAPADIKSTTKVMGAMVDELRDDIHSMIHMKEEEKMVVKKRVKNVTKAIINSGSNLLATKQTASWDSLVTSERSKVVTSLVVTIEDTAFTIAGVMELDETMKNMDDNIMMEVKVMKTDSGTLVDLKLPTFTPDEAWEDNADSIMIPKENLEEFSEDGKVKVVFVAYKNLGQWMSGGEPTSPDRREVVTGHHADEGDAGTEEADSPRDIVTAAQWVVNSNILTTSINNRHKSLKLIKPVTFILKHTNDSWNFDVKCSFWNYSDSTKLGHWSGTGCHVITDGSNTTHTTCECDHLTNFAILMDVSGTKLAAVHEISLQVITYAGCLISICCLLLSFLTFSVFKNLQCDRNTIHKNLVLSLMLAEIIFLAGIQQHEHPVLCSVIAGFLHFFFLAAFAWMCLEGIQLYVMLIEVFEAEKSRLKWYYLFGYGLPTLIVTISAAIDHQGYGTDRHCWLRTDTYFIWSFVGPVAAVITVNIVMLSIAIYMMCRHATTSTSMKSKEHAKMQKYKAWLKGAAVLVVLLGLTWSFGIVYINEETVALAYIFTILNSLQGLFIFTFHCIMNEKVQKEYRKCVSRSAWLPDCLRVGYGRYTGASQSTSPNQSTSSGGNNYFSKLWSGRRRKKSSSSSFIRTSPTRIRNRRPDSASRESGVSSLLSPNNDGYTYPNGSIPRYHGNGHIPDGRDGGIIGDLSVIDCSVIDSEFVSEYCQDKLMIKNENYGGKVYDDNRDSALPEDPEDHYTNIDDVKDHYTNIDDEKDEKSRYSTISDDRYSTISEDSVIKNRLSVISYDEKGNITYSECGDDELIALTNKERILSEHEKVSLDNSSDSERNLVEAVSAHTSPDHHSPKGLRPSVSNVEERSREKYHARAKAESGNVSTPNLKIDIPPPAEVDSDEEESVTLLQNSMPNLTSIDENTETTFNENDLVADRGSDAPPRPARGSDVPPKVKRHSSDIQTKQDQNRFRNSSSDC